jgi:glucose-6-phosphate isomerase
MLTQVPAWNALEHHWRAIETKHLRSLFAEDPTRAEQMAIDAEGIYFDFSRNRITRDTLSLLIDLANQCRLPERIQAMFRGDKINATEKRAVLHTALRAPRAPSSRWMVRTWCRRSTRCWTAWRNSRSVY